MKAKKFLSLCLAVLMCLTTFLATLPTMLLAEGEDATAETTVKIATADELIALATAVNGGETYEGKTIVITADIDLTGKTWTPIGVYATAGDGGTKYLKADVKGEVVYSDGEAVKTRNAVISGLTLTDYANYGAGFIGYFAGSTIEGITLSGANITSTYSYAGGLVGYTAAEATIKNCKVVNSSVTGTANVGAVVAVTGAALTVENVEVNGTTVTSTTTTAKAYGYAGGFFGTTAKDITIKNCSAINVTANAALGYASAVIACNYQKNIVTIDGLTVTGAKVTAAGTYAGAVIAGSWSNKTVISNVTVSNSEITAGSYAGGIMGYVAWVSGQSVQLLGNTVDNVTIKANTKYAGGLIGQQNNSATYGAGENDVSVNTVKNCKLEAGEGYVGAVTGSSNNLTLLAYDVAIYNNILKASYCVGALNGYAKWSNKYYRCVVEGNAIIGTSAEEPYAAILLSYAQAGSSAWDCQFNNGIVRNNTLIAKASTSNALFISYQDNSDKGAKVVFNGNYCENNGTGLVTIATKTADAGAALGSTATFVEPNSVATAGLLDFSCDFSFVPNTAFVTDTRAYIYLYTGDFAVRLKIQRRRVSGKPGVYKTQIGCAYDTDSEAAFWHNDIDPVNFTVKFKSTYDEDTQKTTLKVGIYKKADDSLIREWSKVYDGKLESGITKLVVKTESGAGVDSTSAAYEAYTVSNFKVNGVDSQTMNAVACWKFSSNEDFKANFVSSTNLPVVGITQGTTREATINGNYAGNDKSWHVISDGEVVLSDGEVVTGHTFIIDTPEKWGGLAEIVNAGYDLAGNTIKITADLDLGAYSTYCKVNGIVAPVGKYTTKSIYLKAAVVGAVQDGETTRGAVISNFYLKNYDGYGAGVIGYFAGPSITGLTVKGAHITSNYGYAGIVVGYTGAVVAYTDVHAIDSSVIGNTKLVGGIVGTTGGKQTFNNVSVENCYIETLGESASGIIGYIDKGIEVENVQVKKSTIIAGTKNAGGIVSSFYEKTGTNTYSFNNVTVENCTITTKAGADAAAIAGYTKGLWLYITNCTVTGNTISATGGDYAAGLVGYCTGESGKIIITGNTVNNNTVTNTNKTSAAALIGGTNKWITLGLNEAGKGNIANNNTISAPSYAAVAIAYCGGTMDVKNLSAENNTVTVAGSKAALIAGDLTWTGMANNVTLKNNTVTAKSYSGLLIGGDRNWQFRDELANLYLEGNKLVAVEGNSFIGLFGGALDAAQGVMIYDSEFKNNSIEGTNFKYIAQNNSSLKLVQVKVDGQVLNDYMVPVANGAADTTNDTGKIEGNVNFTWSVDLNYKDITSENCVTFAVETGNGANIFIRFKRMISNNVLKFRVEGQFVTADNNWSNDLFDIWNDNGATKNVTFIFSRDVAAKTFTITLKDTAGSTLVTKSVSYDDATLKDYSSSLWRVKLGLESGTNNVTFNNMKIVSGETVKTDFTLGNNNVAVVKGALNKAFFQYVPETTTTLAAATAEMALTAKAGQDFVLSYKAHLAGANSDTRLYIDLQNDCRIGIGSLVGSRVQNWNSGAYTYNWTDVWSDVQCVNAAVNQWVRIDYPGGNSFCDYWPAADQNDPWKDGVDVIVTYSRDCAAKTLHSVITLTDGTVLEDKIFDCSDTTKYCDITQNVARIRFVANGSATITDIKWTVAAETVASTTPATAPTKEGFYFMGWANDIGTVATAESVIAGETYTPVWKAIPATFALSTDKAKYEFGDDVIITVADPAVTATSNIKLGFVKHGETTPLLTIDLTPVNNDTVITLKQTDYTAINAAGNYDLVYILDGNIVAEKTVALEFVANKLDGAPDWYNVIDTTFTLTTAAQINELAKMVEDDLDDFNNKTIVIGANIDFTGVTLSPIGSAAHPFKGTLKGEVGTDKAAAVISGIVLNNEASCQALIAYYAGPSISNITVSANITTTGSYAAAVVANLMSDAKFENVKVSNSAITALSGAAGLVAYTACNPIFKNCEVDGLTATSTTEADKTYGYVGGIIGFLAMSGKNSDNVYTVQPTMTVQNVTVKNSTFVAARSCVGAVAGCVWSTGDVTVLNVKVENTSVSGSTSVAGIIGSDYSHACMTDVTLTDCTLYAAGGYVGGLVGYRVDGQSQKDAVYTNCKAEGIVITVNAENADAKYVGGLLGFVTETWLSGRTETATTMIGCSVVSSAKRASSITGKDMTGGLVGEHAYVNGNSIIFNNCKVENAIITGHDYVGGIVGYQRQATYYGTATEGTGVEVANCTITGNIAVGGIVGTSGNLTTYMYRVYVHGNTIKGVTDVAGIDGYGINNIVSQASVAQAVVVDGNTIEGTANIGGLVGMHGKKVLDSSNSYDDKRVYADSVVVTNNNFKVPTDCDTYGLIIGYHEGQTGPTMINGGTFDGNKENGVDLTFTEELLIGKKEAYSNITYDPYAGAGSGEEESTTSEAESIAESESKSENASEKASEYQSLVAEELSEEASEEASEAASEVAASEKASEEASKAAKEVADSEKASEEASKAAEEASKKKGCGSTIGVGSALALILVGTIGIAARKKED